MKDDGSSVKLPSFSRPPDAVALDMDGTLLDNQSRLSARTANALEKCLGKGLPIVIATSRAHRSVRRLVGESVTNRCSLVTQNGSFGLGRSPLSGCIREIIPLETARDLMASSLAIEPEICITIEMEGETFGTNNPRDPASLWEMNSATPDMQLTLEQALQQGPSKFAISRRGTDITHLAAMIRERFKGLLSVYPEKTRDFLNITLATAGKTNTLRRLLETKNITMKNVVALGDDLPDYDMLAACGIPVAMGNAVPEIKTLCKYRTAKNDEDGVALVLESY